VSIGDVVSDALRASGYEVALFADGSSASRGFEARAPDLVLLDAGLPDIDGFTLCRLFRRKSREVPIVIVTARDAGIDIAVGLDAGANDYVTKPFSTAVLLARVRARLRDVQTRSPSPALSAIASATRSREGRWPARPTSTCSLDATDPTTTNIRPQAPSQPTSSSRLTNVDSRSPIPLPPFDDTPTTTSPNSSPHSRTRSPQYCATWATPAARQARRTRPRKPSIVLAYRSLLPKLDVRCKTDGRLRRSSESSSVAAHQAAPASWKVPGRHFRLSAACADAFDRPRAPTVIADDFDRVSIDPSTCGPPNQPFRQATRQTPYPCLTTVILPPPRF
jgi:CheY-like chemotaxis protein